MSVTASSTSADRSPDQMLELAVDGGELTVGRWGDGPVQAVLSHGITANHRSFNRVATALVDRGVGVVAVDHRGRGGSSQVAGPYGLKTHAADLLAVADALDADRPVVVGHSMGAWVAANAAEMAPQRWAGVVAIDGGLPVARDLPPGAEVEDVLLAMIGPAMARLDMAFDTVDQIMALWREHPAVGPLVDAAADYLRWDLHEVDGKWCSRVSKEAVLEDGRSMLVDTEAATAMARAAIPTTLLWAPRGLMDETPGLLAPETVASVIGPFPHVTPVLVDDVNHYSIVFESAAVDQIVRTVVGHLEE